MLAAVLQSAGYRTGLYISPFLQVFNERMSVNGAMISGEELGKITEQVRLAAEAMEDRPTEFELMTAIAFLYFRQQRCDIVVLEVGMGCLLYTSHIDRGYADLAGDLACLGADIVRVDEMCIRDRV